MTEFFIQNLLIGMAGSIGVIGFAEYISELRKQFVKNIHVIMTKSATKFITPFSLRVMSGNDVFTDSFDVIENVYLPHLQLVSQADLLLIMPATANIIGKIAHGICDDLLTTTVLCARNPVVIVPHMNSHMYFNKAMQKNIELIKELGYHILEPKVLDKEEKTGGSILDLYQKRGGTAYLSVH